MRKILLAAILCIFAVGTKGADIQKLVQDTQRMAQDPSTILMVWWIPTEFWDVTLRDNPAITDEMRQQFHDTLSSYMVFSVVAVDVGPLGGMKPRGRAAIEAGAEFIVAGSSVPLLTSGAISPDASNFVSMMKPMMANMLGQFGQGMEFLLYPNPVKEGDTSISALQEGHFSYRFFDHRFEWRLPVGSLLPPKIDPASGEEFPGDYKFNPYTGERLKPKQVQPGATDNPGDAQ